MESSTLTLIFRLIIIFWISLVSFNVNSIDIEKEVENYLENHSFVLESEENGTELTCEELLELVGSY